MESEVLHFDGTMPRFSLNANFMPRSSDGGFFLELSTEIRTNIIQRKGTVTAAIMVMQAMVTRISRNFQFISSSFGADILQQKAVKETF